MKSNKKDSKKEKFERNITYNNFIENIPFPVVKISPKLSITDCNGELTILTGYTRKELLKKKINDLFVEESSKKDFKNNILALYNNELEKSEFHLKIKTKNNMIFWVNIISKKNYSNANTEKGYICFIKNITNEKNLENKLCEEKEKRNDIENQMNLILDNIPAVIFYKDTQNNYIKVNYFGAKAHKLKKEDLEGKNCKDLYPKEIAQKYWQDDLEVIRNSRAKINITEPWFTEEEIKWVQTSKIPLKDNNNKVKGVLGFSVDITKQKEKEFELSKALEESEKSLLIIKELLTAYKTIQNIQSFDYAAKTLFLQCKQLIGATSGYLTLLSKDKEVEQVLFLDPEDLSFNVDKNLPLPIRELKAEAYKTGGTVFNNDIMNNECVKFISEGDMILKNILLSPINIEGKTCGIMGLANKGDNFNDTDKIIAEAFGDLIAGTLINNSLIEQLKRSEERFKILFEYAPAAYFFFDMKGTFLEVNKHGEQILKYSKGEIIGKTYIDLQILSEAEIDKGNKLLEESLYEKSTGPTVFSLIDKNKSNIMVEIHTYPININKQKYILAIVQDITERENIEDQIRRSEKKYRLIVENLKEGYYEVSIGGRYIYVNNAFCKLIESTKEMVIGSRYKSFMDEEMIQFMIRKYIEVFTQETSIDKLEFYYTLKNGKNVPAEASVDILYNEMGKKIGFFGLVRDVRERKQLEILLEQIAVSEKKYRSVIENIKEGYYEITQHARYTYFNDALSEMLGYSREEMYDLRMRDQYNEETKNYLHKAFADLYLEEKDGITMEYEFIKRDGTKLFLETSAYIKYDNDGKKVGFYGLVRDNTKKKAMEEFMEELNEFLEAEVRSRTEELQNALEEQKKYLDEIVKSSQFKTDFMATMSHELRTPLNAIIGFTDLLLEGLLGEISDVQEEYIADIKSSAEHQLTMINGILDISKIESGQVNLNKSWFLLDLILEQVISSFKLQIKEKELELKKFGLKTETTIYADPVRIKEIFSNLLSNALKYTIKGQIQIIFEESMKEWIFKIKDTGIGIAEKDHGIIFKEFKRVNSPYVRSVQGTGLGLSLIKRLINLHGGEIWFESKLEQGSTFIFTIPKPEFDRI